MTISVLPSAAAMTAILDAPLPERPDLVRSLWSPLAGMYHFVPGDVDLAAVHRQQFGFAWDGETEAVRAAIDRLRAADAWERIDRALRTGLSALRTANPGLPVPEITVLLLVGDHSQPHFREEIRGLSAFGGISGYIVITVWPSPEVLDRLEAIAVHELHHNLRYSPGGVRWDPQTVTVGEQIVAEGLADQFAVELYGERGLSHFVSEETRSDDAVLRTVVGGLGVTGMAHFAAWVHGDATARLFGAEPVGLPTGAGYAAGLRLVRAALADTTSTAAASLSTPAESILRIALRRLGFPSESERLDGTTTPPATGA